MLYSYRCIYESDRVALCTYLSTQNALHLFDLNDDVLMSSFINRGVQLIRFSDRKAIRGTSWEWKMSAIGQVLKEGRLALGLDIEDIAQRTRICGRYLRAMEDDRFEAIPKVFDRGYLKIYADFLRVDAKPLLTLYEQQLQSRVIVPRR